MFYARQTSYYSIIWYIIPSSRLVTLQWNINQSNESTTRQNGKISLGLQRMSHDAFYVALWSSITVIEKKGVDSNTMMEIPLWILANIFGTHRNVLSVWLKVEREESNIHNSFCHRLNGTWMAAMGMPEGVTILQVTCRWSAGSLLSEVNMTHHIVLIMFIADQRIDILFIIPDIVNDPTVLLFTKQRNKWFCDQAINVIRYLCQFWILLLMGMTWRKLNFFQKITYFYESFKQLSPG